jgi:PAS domain S-box-containing protein
MLEEIISNPDLRKYHATFGAGQIIFLEGDDSKELYILVSGELDILKGRSKISEVTEQGTLFGEMSFLLEARRTATVRAKNDVRAIRIPKEEVTVFLAEFPEAAKKITEVLAQRLNRMSYILYGLKELCDQLPDAVMVTDGTGKILTWNKGAEELYGRDWDQIRNTSVEEIYEDPKDFEAYLSGVKTQDVSRERILKIRHPEKGTRFVSTSTTALYDGHHNFQGILFLGRDVTASVNLERRYHRVRYWVLPFIILLGLSATAIFYGYPYYSKGHQAVDFKKKDLRNQLARDYLLLRYSLADSFAAGDSSKSTRLMKEFFDIHGSALLPYTGLVLLDKDKRVFGAYSTTPGADMRNVVGESYAGIKFHGDEESIHRVLSLYRTDTDHPTGHKGVEMAFEMRRGEDFLGWLVFQMNMDMLDREYNIDEEGLKKFQFR